MKFDTEVKNPQHYHHVAMAFICCLVMAQFLSVKIIALGPFTPPAGIIVYPLSFVICDILTEVYGFNRAKSVIWFGFLMIFFVAVFSTVAANLPPAVFWTDQATYAKFFGLVPRIALAGIVASFTGEMINSYVLHRMKCKHGSNHFGIRAILSSIAGQGVDSLIFNTLAFAGIMGSSDLLRVMISGYLLKCGYEILVLPLTMFVVRRVSVLEEVRSTTLSPVT